MSKLLSAVSLEEWKKRSALALEDIIKKTLENTTQLAIEVDMDNISILRRHYKARFSFFKFLRLRDKFYTDTFYLDVRSV